MNAFSDSGMLFAFATPSCALAKASLAVLLHEVGMCLYNRTLVFRMNDNSGNNSAGVVSYCGELESDGGGWESISLAPVTGG